LDIRSGLDSIRVGDSEDITLSFFGEKLSYFRLVSATEKTSMINDSPLEILLIGSNSDFSP
jgi:hypothetical protein